VGDWAETKAAREEKATRVLEKNILTLMVFFLLKKVFVKVNKKRVMV